MPWRDGVNPEILGKYKSSTDFGHHSISLSIWTDLMASHEDAEECL